MPVDHLINRRRAIETLSASLSDGSLVLFVGAGTSLGAGLPMWHELVRRLRKRAGLPNDGITSTSTADQLLSATTEVRRDFCKEDDAVFAALVKECLYEGLDKLSSNILRDDLLIALGALMTGSRRGHVGRVVTYNFDSILEWYIKLYGLVPRVVTELPALEGAEDVRIYHPQGFLAHRDVAMHDSAFVILDLDAINERLGTQGDQWFELLRHTLRTGLGLFIGVSPRSFRDRGLAPLLKTVGKELNDRRPTAFWVIVEQREDGTLMEASERGALERDFLSYNVVPLFLRTKADVPPFLLEICQESASRLNIV